jgi:hypothetical protein
MKNVAILLCVLWIFSLFTGQPTSWAIPVLFVAATLALANRLVTAGTSYKATPRLEA